MTVSQVLIPAALVSLAAALPGGLVLARLELDGGTRQTTKLIIANQRKAAPR